MASLRERIIEILLSRELISKEQLDEALVLQRSHGGSLQKILVDRDLVKESDILAAMSEGLGIPAISLARVRLDTTLQALIPRDLAKQYQLVPVACMGKTLTVAMADPLNVFALDTI